MKLLKFLILSFLLSTFFVFNLKGQDALPIQAPHLPSLQTDKDYSKAESTIIECAKWLQTTDLDKEKKKRLEIEYFVFNWIYGSPNNRKKAVFYQQLNNLTDNNKALFGVFHANYFRYYIEKKNKANHKGAIKAGLLSIVSVYNKGIAINRNEQILNLSKSNATKQLDNYIEKYFSIKKAQFGSIIKEDNEIPDELPPSLSELKKRDGRVKNKTLEEDADGVDDVLVVQTKTAKKKTKEPEVYTFSEVMPKFDGDLKKYLKQNLKYPPIASENQIEGKVLVQFMIDKNGFIDKKTIKIKGNKPGWGLEQEAIRLVSEMPRWIPAKQNGKTVS
jgi:TonB family protein